MNEEEKTLVKQALEKIRLTALCQCHDSIAKARLDDADEFLAIVERIDVLARSMEAA